MERSPWWHVAIYTVAALVSVLVVALDPSTSGRIGGVAAAAALALGWALIGRHAWRSPRAAVAYAVVVVLIAGAGTAFSPNFAFVQVVAFPLVWTLTPTLRTAIGANIALVISVVAGFLVSTGTSAEAITTALVVETGSLAFSLAFGLWIGAIETRSEERRRLLDELRATQAALAAANRDIGVTEERERLAREIHDTIAQDLTGLVMLTQRTRRDVASGDPTAIAESLELLESSARSTLTETRGLVAATAGTDVGTGGLADALRRLGERFARETGVDVAVEASASGAIARDVEVVLLRIAQESLANVRKHADATTATLRLERLPGAIRLTVTDDGIGFDPVDRAPGFGLDGMRERLALVGGALEVLSRAGEGTALVATLPDGGALAASSAGATRTAGGALAAGATPRAPHPFETEQPQDATRASGTRNVEVGS